MTDNKDVKTASNNSYLSWAITAELVERHVLNPKHIIIVLNFKNSFKAVIDTPRTPQVK